METIYKLTDQNLRTYNNIQWAPGEWKHASKGGLLWPSGWLHCYRDPLVAIFLNPIHADITNPVLWQGEAQGKYFNDHHLFSNCAYIVGYTDFCNCRYSEMRIVKRLKPYKYTLEKLVEIAIICAIETGYNDENFITWAIHWINNNDRSRKAAAKAAKTARMTATLGEVRIMEAWATQAKRRIADSWAMRAAVRAAEAWLTRIAEAWLTRAERRTETQTEKKNYNTFDFAKILHELCD
jgi:hypothetical protein